MPDARVRAVVIAPQWIGDAVMSEPLIATLAGRGEHVSVAALPWVAPVYRAMASVAAVESLPFAHGRLDWSARRALARQWRGRFDVAYVLPNSLKAALLPWLARVPLRVGYLGEQRRLLLNRRLANPPGRPPMVAFYRALAQAAQGAHADAPAVPAPVAEHDQPWHGPHADAPGADAAPRLALASDRVARLLAQRGLAPRSYVAMAPGAEFGPAKCWPAEHFADLARRLHADRGLTVVLLGSPKEAELAARIARLAGPGCLALAGSTDLDEAMALIAGAAGLVSNDSGLMHVAAAFGLPQVAVFGSSSPEHTPPLNARARVLWLKHEIGLACSPCFERTCRYGHTRCLVDIGPERVRLALDDAWGPTAAAAHPASRAPMRLAQAS
jgi:heptosyltransferase-2